MKIFAHRGMCDIYPENSRSAIFEALNKGFDVEVDIRFTADNKVLIIHDEGLSRLCGVNKKINELKAREIADLRFLSKRDEQPLFLDDLFSSSIIKNKFIAIHYKQSDQNDQNNEIIARLLRKYKLYECCFLFNLSLDSCHSFKKIDSRIKISLLISDEKFEPFIYRWDEVASENRLFDIVWAAEYKSLYDMAFFNSVSKFNKKIIVVSPELHKKLDHPKAFNGYQELWPQFVRGKVDGICTDFPKECYEFLSGKNRTEKAIIES